MNLSDAVFNPGAPFTKHREVGKGATYIQRGIKFNTAFKPIELTGEKIEDPLEGMDDKAIRRELRKRMRADLVSKTKPIKKKTKKKTKTPEKPMIQMTARERAHNKLKAFKEVVPNDRAGLALKENQKALQAEQKFS